ncbi:venom carboxylesterase-6-like [Penaeus japonicus]|uniref:venom carboxylesterase-6-like n=1 Tax=Penaeus japonicus TaxID=27405 RepID=UPI001C713177|nr:venom carboxylesterase-6-like [Penaeus japonicus]
MSFHKLQAILLVATAMILATWAEETIIANTMEGKISGIKEEAAGGRTFFSFYSIPFAQPPIGKLRFKDPLPAEPWEGVKNGSSNAPACPQMDFMNPTELMGDEDCLYLNVFTPQLAEGAGDGLPVMVYIHGGAFFGGFAAIYRPHILLDQDIVLVTIQYRVGTLGFLSTEDEVIPGNFGLKDQSLALRWVQRNIRNFGGDPSQVTVFGLSAGGASVHYQILSPHSEGLFKRAIMQSGSALCPWAMGGAFKDVAHYTGSLAGCPTSDSQLLLECLQNADKNLVVSIVWKLMAFHINPMILGPRVDKDFVPDNPYRLVKEGRHQHVDVISGVTSHEGSLFSKGIYKSEEILEDFNKNFAVKGPLILEFREGDVDLAAVSERIFQHYAGTTHVTLSHAESVNEMLSDRHFVLPHDITTKYLVRHGSSINVYAYNFAYRGEHTLMSITPSLVNDRPWVGHGDDMLYHFPGFLTSPVMSPDDLKIRNLMVKLWINFATTGNPTPDDSLGFTWDPTTQETRHHRLNINKDIAMEEKNREEVFDFWATLPMLENVILHPEKVSDLGRYWLELANQRAQPWVGPGDETPRKPTKHRDEL